MLEKERIGINVQAKGYCGAILEEEERIHGGNMRLQGQWGQCHERLALRNNCNWK